MNTVFTQLYFNCCRHLMQSKKIRISYCAAEIIAHLACEPSWKTYTLNSKGEILKDLELAVKEWAPPEKIIVMYRSFQSFIDLFNSIDTPQAQLWAAWAILHVCTINGQYILFIVLTKIIRIN